MTTESNGSIASKEDFKEMVEEVLSDLKDPDGDFNVIFREGPDFIAGVRKFEPQLADLFVTFLGSLDDVIQHIRSKDESASHN